MGIREAVALVTALGFIAVSSALVAFSGVAVLPRRVPAYLSTALHLLGCIIGLCGVASAFVRTATPARYAWQVPGGALRFVIDPLAAFFLVPVFVVAGLGALYGEGYWSDAEYPRTARKLRCFYGVLTAGLVLVMIAGDAWSFLAGWEIVGLAAYFLVTTDGEPEALRAGWIYLIATHTGTLVLFAMFALIRSATGSWELTRSNALASSPLLLPVLVLALIGFGIKAGVMPLHVWLPEAHAAAPSHVSAILSAVVLKMGIYGLVRTIFLTTALPSWFGITLLLLGSISGVLGVVFALAQHDLKRLLAYHSIENIGIILIGLGVGVIGSTTGHPDLAILGYAGGLLHVWNHAAFKALLFYAAGAVVHTTRTRNMEALGGLIRTMRTTALAFAVGAVAICGLPPLNGFVSEWLLYLASFRALRDGTPITPLATIAAPTLALIGALALACFVKAFSAVFLGRPRTNIGQPHEATLSMRTTMLALCFACTTIGLWPSGAGMLAGRATSLLTGGRAEAAVAAALRPLTLTGPMLVVLTALIAFLSRTLLRGARTVPTWDCGYAQPTSRMQYTSSSFAQQLVRLFGWVLLPVTHRPAVNAIFPTPQHFESHVPDPVLDRLLLPAVGRSHRIMSLARIIQAGHVQTYLVYIAGTLILLLSWSAM